MVLVIAAVWLFSVMIYDDNFNKRFESYEPLMFYVDDFDGLQRVRYTFPSDKEQSLTGYMYSSGEDQRGIIILAHGFGGGGHNSYMNCVNFFAQNGYYVFAYDATGNDESEGSGVGGLPQGVIDLNNAISFVESSDDFPKLPIVLFGHSWGGYSVSAALTYHPEVSAVIECSGFNRSSDMFEAEGIRQVGGAAYIMMPFVKLYELMKYGEYASNTALDGFASTDAEIMIVHSADDSSVPTKYGYDLYYDKYRDDPRFHFIRLEDRGHDCIYDDTYVNEFNSGFDKWLETLGYDYTAAENKDRFVADKADYIHENLDRGRWRDRLNTELFDVFLDFCDENTK